MAHNLVQLMIQKNTAVWPLASNPAYATSKMWPSLLDGRMPESHLKQWHIFMTSLDVREIPLKMAAGGGGGAGEFFMHNDFCASCAVVVSQLHE